jgi:hypothetical protein
MYQTDQEAKAHKRLFYQTPLFLTDQEAKAHKQLFHHKSDLLDRIEEKMQLLEGFSKM